jgi:hypothetical protein
MAAQEKNFLARVIAQKIHSIAGALSVTLLAVDPFSLISPFLSLISDVVIIRVPSIVSSVTCFFPFGI